MHKLDDDRFLMASEKDIMEFFREHDIIGRTIVDLGCTVWDFMIRNLEVVENILDLDTECAINTDGALWLMFDNGEIISIEFSGDGPIILGTMDNDVFYWEEETYDGRSYRLHTLFTHCIGRTVMDIELVKSGRKMQFPVYRGIDMSGEDECIKEICLKFDNDTYLGTGGSGDFFWCGHLDNSDEYLRVPYKELFVRLNDDTIDRIFQDEPETRERLHVLRAEAQRYMDVTVSMTPLEYAMYINKDGTFDGKYLKDLKDAESLLEVSADGEYIYPVGLGPEEFLPAWNAYIRFRSLNANNLKISEETMKSGNQERIDELRKWLSLYEQHPDWKGKDSYTMRKLCQAYVSGELCEIT